jgi:AmiR/NasT family two-component response regulator
VAVVRRLAQDVRELRTRADQLERALESRIAIEQAKGVLAERLGITPEQAFGILRRSARSAQVKLHDLALDVVVSPSTPEPVRHELSKRSEVA